MQDVRITSGTATIKSDVRQFIVRSFLFGDESTQFADSASLLQSNLIDSTGILELVQFIEETYSVIVADEEMIPENLDSLDNIERYVVAKRAQQPI